MVYSGVNTALLAGRGPARPAGLLVGGGGAAARRPHPVAPTRHRDLLRLRQLAHRRRRRRPGSDAFLVTIFQMTG